MLLGFFDDSGKETDPSNRIVCAAGYIAAANNIWSAFHELWRNTLLFHGMTALHMRDFMCEHSKEQPASGWDWPKKRQVLEQFSGCIKVSQLVGFGVAIDADAWRELPKDLTRIEGNAQEFCFMRLIRMAVTRILRSCPQEHLSIAFDCDRAATAARFKRYLGIRDKYPDEARILSSFAIAEPQNYYPLQAADLLAWETRTQLLRQIKGLPSRPEFEHMMEGMPGVFPDYTSELWTREAIESHLNAFHKAHCSPMQVRDANPAFGK